MSLAVRRVDPGDAGVLRTVRLAALADSPEAFTSTWEAEAAFDDEVWTARARRGATDDAGTATFLLVDGDEVAPVGLVVGNRSGPDPTRVEVVSMWVHPAHRRAGGGGLLVGAVAAWAAAGGAVALDLWVVRGNGGARAFYERLGFGATDAGATSPDDPCRDELRMTLPVRGR